MNNYAFKAFGVLCLFVLGMFALTAFNGEKFAGPSTYRYAFTADTITNAEKDTLSFPVNLLSNFQLNVSTVRTSLSGTHNVKVYLDESNLTTGTTDWRVIDSTSTTTATVATIRQATIYGVRYRLRVSGTGTQSSRYTLQLTAKPVNN